MPRLLGPAVIALIGLAGCVAGAPPVASEDDALTVDTSTPEARRQFDANVAFARSYEPRCASLAKSKRPRVLLTGFGRFMGIEDNATGRIVSTLVPGAPYPLTKAPAEGEVDDPAPQLSVGTATLELPDVGEVDVCAMILPVYWDLAAVLVAKELAAIKPSFVLMNGVSDPRQPLWLELGAMNRAAPQTDGANVLTPAVPRGANAAKVIASAAPSETAQPNLLSWNAVQAAASAAIRAHADEVDGEERFGDVLQDPLFAGFPRSWNTYLCNNLTYVTGWLMTHPGREVHLLNASKHLANAANYVPVKMTTDFSKVPRVFVHWPSDLADKHHAAGADVLKAILAAQLTASKNGDAPTPGDASTAGPGLEADPPAAN